MKKHKKILILVLIIGVLFSGSGCTSGQYTQEDIDTLKMYSYISVQYWQFEFFTKNLERDIYSFKDAMEAVMRKERPDAVNDLKRIINNHESNHESFKNISQQRLDLIEKTKGKDVDISDINIMLSDIDKVITFLDEAYIIAEEYIETEIPSREVVEMIFNIDIYEELISDVYYKSFYRQLDFFELIQEYN